MHENLRQALLKVLNANSLRFFGLLVYNVEFVGPVENDPFISTMCIGFENRKWTCWWNLQFVEKKTPREMVYVVCHEIIHMLSGHIFRRADRDEVIWALAIDHVINVALDEDIRKSVLSNIEMPLDRMIIDALNNYGFISWSAEQVYDWLKQYSKILHKGDGFYQVVINPPNGSSQTITYQTDIRFSDDPRAQKAQRELSAQARAHVNSSRGKGLIGGRIRELLSQILDMYIPPEVILENALKLELAASDNRSWRNLNKRLFAHGIIAPAADLEPLLGDVICLVDHSGSIGHKDAAKFSGAIRNCASLFRRLHIVKHDVNIIKDGGISILSSDEVYHSEVLFEMVGRGGTSHRAVFRYVQDQFDFGEPISIVLIFTDWDSDIPSIWNTFNWHKEVPVIHIVPEGKKAIISKSYGRVLELFKK